VYWLGRLWPDRGDGSTTPRILTGMEAPLGLFLLFCVLQTLPLPAAVLQRISPGSARLYREPDPADSGLIEEATASSSAAPPLKYIDGARPRPVSVNPSQTWARIRMVASFAALLLLTVWWSQRDRILFLLTAVTVVGFLVSVFGLVQFLTWNG